MWPVVVDNLDAGDTLRERQPARVANQFRDNNIRGEAMHLRRSANELRPRARRLRPRVENDFVLPGRVGAGMPVRRHKQHVGARTNQRLGVDTSEWTHPGREPQHPHTAHIARSFDDCRNRRFIGIGHRFDGVDFAHSLETLLAQIVPRLDVV